MADTVKIGNMNIPKPALIIGIAAGGGILFYAYWMRSSDGGTETPTVASTDNLDPYTGLPYVDEYGFGGGGYSGVGIYDPGSGQTVGTGLGGTVTGNTTNAAWAQAAQAYLSTAGFDPTKVSVALGKALTGQVVTSDELNIFNAARAIQGEPPMPYPAIRTTGPNTQPPGTTNPPKTPGSKLPKPGNLHVIAKGGTGRNRWVRVDWNGVKDAKFYEVWMVQDNPGGNTPHGIIRKTTITTDSQLGGLWENRRYRIDVHPIGHDGGRGAKATVFYKTPK